MAHITHEELLKLAHLSHIALNAQELQTLLPALDGVLAYAARVTEFQHTTEPEKTIPTTPLRTDTVEQYNATELLACAPQVESNYLVVPAIIKQDKNA